jgi:hypothetical protein
MTPLSDPDTAQELVVQPGIFDRAIKERIEHSLNQTVPEGKRVAVLFIGESQGTLDTTRVGVGVVAKLDKRGNWKLEAEAKKLLSGPVSGRVLLHAAF